jgi:hypothetical protein
LGLSWIAAIAGTPRIKNGNAFAVDLAGRSRDRHNIDVRPDAPQPFGVRVGSS